MASRILVPYDGSYSSDKAVRQTIELVKSLSKNAEIILFHVVPEIHLQANYIRGMRISYVKSAYQHRREIYQLTRIHALDMLNIKKDEFKDAGINNVESRVSIGNPVKLILALASTEKVNLIVIGSVGLSGMARLKAVGSVSRGVSERAKCPVLIVH
ncbi:MAG TPA: universal stress protein [Nitrososphaeraceae archaeon]